MGFFKFVLLSASEARPLVARSQARSRRSGCHTWLWNLHDITNASRQFVNIISPRSRSIKRRQWKPKLDYHGVVFAHLATGCGINAKDPEGLDSDRWIPHSRCCEYPARAKALAGFSRHLSAGFTDLNPAPWGLSLYRFVADSPRSRVTEHGGRCIASPAWATQTEPSFDWTREPRG